MRSEEARTADRRFAGRPPTPGPVVVRPGVDGAGEAERKMAMPVDFWDAIRLFESSQTGQGKGPDEDADLKGLATDTVRKLWELHSQGRILFAPMPEGEEGEGAGEGACRVVRVNQVYR